MPGRRGVRSVPEQDGPSGSRCDFEKPRTRIGACDRTQPRPALVDTGRMTSANGSLVGLARPWLMAQLELGRARARADHLALSDVIERVDRERAAFRTSAEP